MLIRLVVILTLIPVSSADAQQSQDAANRAYCAELSKSVQRPDAFAHFCNWVVAFDAHLPNIIGNQETRRFHTGNGRDLELVDTTSARVAYVDGKPHFSDIAINHVKLLDESHETNLLKLHGAWSYDDFGGALRLLFGSHTSTHFAFGTESDWHGIPVLVFGYEVPRAENHRWELKTVDKQHAAISDFPAYRGRIVLDGRTFDLLLFDRESTDATKHFPIRYASNRVEYKLVPLGDGTSFVLPVEAEVRFCHDDKRKNCEVNQTTFHNWQKFGAKSRILTGAEPEQ